MCLQSHAGIIQTGVEQDSFLGIISALRHPIDRSKLRDFYDNLKY